ncbi:unnamed protein product [Eruca vesicaria subsp. sativa]|uniref:Translation elongation factor EF1B beta/delta subunit guanine nucleotide exchange domain-containing protein n=1 Tax=Eruca vesicaria subsp. sativa TaxID=29727 RepID=A0ABC8JCI9_ERUVS|nr:unnamed protein product [Eruca vesicaria subsp. sativa]
MEGLIWGSSKIVPVGYGVKVLRIIASTPINEQYDLADTLCVDHITSFGSSCVYFSVLQSLVLINPKDDEADIKKLEETVRSIKLDGLFWGASKLVPIDYGIKLLGIECTMLGLLGMELCTIIKEKIMDSTYVQSCQTLMLNRIFNWVCFIGLSDCTAAGKSGLVFSELYSGNSDVKKLEESIRSLQTEGVVWGASKIVKVGYGIKFLRMVFTIVDDRLCFNTVIRNTGGIPLNRICKQSKILEAER